MSQEEGIGQVGSWMLVGIVCRLSYFIIPFMRGGFKGRRRVQEPFDYVQKIIIIGDSGVGKSNMLLRYTEGMFVDNYMMTIGINYVFKVLAVDGTRIKLQIWDTAGQEKYKTITQTYYRNSEGVLVVFSLNSRDSFQNIQGWIEDLTQAGANAAQIMIVGNKMDLAESREVSYEEAAQLARNNGVSYMECSAKNGDNVDALFTALARKMKAKFIDEPTEEPRKPEPLDPPGKSVRERCCTT